MTEIIQLSKREKEVAEALLQGMSNKEIAASLGISESTVEFHIKNLYSKLHVTSRTEAVLKLRESIAVDKLRKSTVDNNSGNINNKYEPILQVQETSASSRKIGIYRLSKLFGEYKILILLGMLFVAILLFVLAKPVPWNGYERECEYPDDVTVGEMIKRVGASGSMVHGQFGTVAAWPPKPGYVKYNNIETPRVDQLYLKLRYSKYSPASVPIQIYIDDELTPRATFYPNNQESWDRFVWSEPILLGRIRRGTHSIKFLTEGQQYGVADLDKFILMTEMPQP